MPLGVGFRAMSDRTEKRSSPERRAATDRRTNGDRRSGLGRRQVRDGDTTIDWEGIERRQGLVDRRAQFLSDRRAEEDRRAKDRRRGDRGSPKASRPKDADLGDRAR